MLYIISKMNKLFDNALPKFVGALCIAGGFTKKCDVTYTDCDVTYVMK